MIGKLPCGNPRKRDEVLRSLNDLPQAVIASQEEVLHLVERKKLMRLGTGFIIRASAPLGSSRQLSQP